MKYTLRFLPEVVQDAINGYTWYETKAIGLGEEFLFVFYSAAGEIPDNPLFWQKIYRQVRRRLLRRFPYAIYYTIERDEVIVEGLFHCARDPSVVNDELQRREGFGNH